MSAERSGDAGPAAARPSWFLFSRGARDWLPVALAGLALAAASWPLDGTISDAAQAVRLSGDFRRELEALAQYGQGSATVLAAVAVWLLDPARRRRLIDWAAAAILVGVACVAMKMLIGRPRPLLDDPHVLLGPWGMHPVPVRDGEVTRTILAHAWEMTSRVQYALGSMPSRHTAFAAVMSAALWSMYPRLWPLALAMLALVGTMRVIVQAHYPSDVFIGAALGVSITTLCMRRFWGTRALDWLWKNLVDRDATPALERVVATEAERLAKR